MSTADRRVIRRFGFRIPLRFRPIGLAHDQRDHAAESINVSRCGVYFASPVRMPVGMAVELSIEIPRVVTGFETFRGRCLGRVVHAEEGTLGDGTIGYGVKIERFVAQGRAELRQDPSLVESGDLVCVGS